MGALTSRKNKYRSVIALVTMGEQCTRFLTPFLHGIGLSATEAGAITSLNSIMSITGDPVWGIISDKIRNTGKVLIICFAIGALLYGLVPATASAAIPLLFVLLPLCSFFQTPGHHIVENLLVRSCDHEKLNFGSIRCFGSLSYGIVGILFYFTLHGLDGIKLTFYLYALFLAAALGIFFTLHTPPAAGQKSRKFKEMDFKGLFGNYFYVAYILFAILQKLPMSATATFYAYLLADMKIDTTAVGLLFGFGALFEIPSFLLFSRIRKKIPLQYIIIFSAVIGSIECILLRSCTSLWQLLALRAVIGFSTGLSMGASSFYILSLAPKSLKTTAQTLNYAVVSLTGIVGNAAGGVLVDAVGAGSFFFYSGLVSIAAVVLYVCTFPFAKLALKKTLPGINAG